MLLCVSDEGPVVCPRLLAWLAEVAARVLEGYTGFWFLPPAILVPTILPAVKNAFIAWME